ncbi:MAG: MucR family transcriptional regulator [Alphaproteobacteria bacterium]|nr:MucR family transcriptional regulator [Alphaproteobacteria bacterium]
MADAVTDQSPTVPPELGLACALLEAYVQKNQLPAGDVPAALRKIYGALTGLQGRLTGTQTSAKPAVPVRKSIADDYLVCLEDGRKLSMLKRHLRTRHGLSPGDYRAKWGLPADYPMTAPRYAKTRSALAKEAGLGRYPGAGRRTREDLPSGQKA